MSVEHLAAVLHHSRAKGTAKLVLLGIANHQGDGGAWPSVATLAKYANVDERNVQRAIAKLVSTGELSCDVQAGGPLGLDDHRRPNRYDVSVVCPPWCDRTPNHRDTRTLAGRQRTLWKTGVADSPPGGASATPVVAPVSPGGVAPAPPEPSIEPDPTPASASTTGHARVVLPPPDWRPCVTCSLPQRECERRQTKLLPGDQHPYEPTRRVAP